MICRPWRLSRKVLQVRIRRGRCRDCTLPGHGRQCWLSPKAIDTVCWWRRQLWCRGQTHLLLAWGQQPRALESCRMPGRHAGARSSTGTWARNCVRWVRNDNQSCAKAALFCSTLSYSMEVIVDPILTVLPQWTLCLSTWKAMAEVSADSVPLFLLALFAINPAAGVDGQRVREARVGQLFTRTPTDHSAFKTLLHCRMWNNILFAQ